MFDLYGPNSLKVNSYIEALQKLTTEQLEAINLSKYEFTQIKAIIDKINQFIDKRVEESSNALKNAQEAVKDKGSQGRQLIVSHIAVWLVLEDFLDENDRNFIYLYLIDQFIPLKVLKENYKKEDWAIEIFCDQLSKVDEQRVSLDSRPDARGKGKEGLPDFIIFRNGIKYTVEHTSINTFEMQEYYNRLWDKYFKPLEIEQKVNVRHPNKWVNIYVPLDAIKTENLARSYDFDAFLEKILEAIDKTPESYNAGQFYSHEFKKPDFRVFISIGEGFNGCFLVRIAPTNSEQLEKHLDERIARAIERKQPKLKRAKIKGEYTILLLDCDDYSLVNVYMLSDAFSRAVGKSKDILDGIDEVYILHQGGSGIVAPLKLGERIYPNLPEFKKYIFKELRLKE